jgi:uncharacterized protein
MGQKNAIILHGTGDKPDQFWFPYLKKNLEARGYSVWLPQLPNAEKPNLKEWLPFVLQNGTISNDTILIGHSAGAQLILSILQKIDCQVKQAILVSGYAESLPSDSDSKSKEREKLDWKVMKSHVKDIIFINSDNDPWGCNDKQGRVMFDHLGGAQIILHEGHMGSTTHKQSYKEFPLLTRLVID